MKFYSTAGSNTSRVLPLNPVKPKVRFDGEEFLFESLVLEQSMNSCQRFEVVKEFLSQDEMWKADPDNLIGMIGSRALIYMEHLDGSHPYEFSGWVTDVQIDSWEDDAGCGEYRHRSNKVRIIGQGDVVSLDGTPTMNSYIDKQLSDIVAWTTEKAQFEVKCQPKYKGILPYAMQYGESNFEFLNRLSYIYGELFFYDGRTLFFGTPDDPRSEDLFVDQDLFSLRTYSSAVPRKYTGYGYLPMEDQFVRTPECFEPNSDNELLKIITAKSDLLFPDKGVIESGTAAHYDSHIYDMADNRRLDAAGRMMNIEGETRTCRIKLGGLVNILFPRTMNVPSLGQYRITRINHYIDKNGNYSNHFYAMPNKYEYVPERFPHKLIAYPEIATVFDNNDPRKQGRVQVQFYWQKPLSLNTNWLRVQTPDAGSSDKVSSNRGFVAIPEVGDQVMVGFEYGDPHRPFVMGSLFHGKSGQGGFKENHLKSISTRSGHHIIFDDNEQGDWGITIKDANGNSIRLDTKGKNIEILAPETMAFKAKNIQMYANEEIDVNAKGNVCINSEKETQVNANEEIILKSKGITAKSEQEIMLKSDGRFTANVANDINISASDIKAKGTGDVELKGTEMIISGQKTTLEGAAFKMEIS